MTTGVGLLHSFVLQPCQRGSFLCLSYPWISARRSCGSTATLHKILCLTTETYTRGFTPKNYVVSISAERVGCIKNREMLLLPILPEFFRNLPEPTIQNLLLRVLRFRNYSGTLEDTGQG